MASITRGGRLYDNWFKELHEHAPAAHHPAWPEEARAGVAPGATWTCVACHGWDYRGRDDLGFPGISGRIGDDPQAIAALLTAPEHGYGEMLRPREITDLARFVAWGQSHLVADIDPVTRTLRGTGTPDGAVYHTVCASCHGGDGKEVESIAPLGDLARDNPWMVMHNIINGHAGGAMPSLKALSEGAAVDTLAAIQALPHREPQAAMARGGRLYGDWIKETHRAAPRDPHPSWRGPLPANVAYTWRCRDCHGWDYQGKDGAAAAVSPVPFGPLPAPNTGTEAGTGTTPDAVLAVLTDSTHRYKGVLTKRDLSDLAEFVANGRFPMDWLIDPQTGRFTSTGEGYGDHYDTLCASCHGTTGTAVRTMPPLGRVVHEDPWRSLHNVLNGHAGEAMPPMRVFPLDMSAAILAYIQNELPTAR